MLEGLGGAERGGRKPITSPVAAEWSKAELNEWDTG